MIFLGSNKYQPQVNQLESLDPKTESKTEMKPVKQTVTYDSSTGKMYEELGSTSSSSVSGRSSYFQNYQSYPYSAGMQPSQYMTGSYASPGYVGPYDR